MPSVFISNFAFFVLALASTAVAQDVAIPSPSMDPVVRDYILKMHNGLRGNINYIANMRKLEYDIKLECAAQKTLDRISAYEGPSESAVADYTTCGGSPSVTIGQNHFNGRPFDATINWVDTPGPDGCTQRERYMANIFIGGSEAGDRDLDSTGFALANCMGFNRLSTFKDFSQVMWAETSYVGCAYKDAVGTLCFYSEAGNTVVNNTILNPIGIAGDFCTACPEGYPRCEKRLCVP
eukprot:Ihof_evm10s152 gene=Ihof_evmTU10s152